MTARARAAAVAALTGAAGLAAFGLLSPAHADPSPATVTFATPNTPGATISVAGTDLAGQVSRPGGFVDTVQISVAWTDNAPGRKPGNHPTQTTTITPPTRQASFGWTYAPSLAWNGQYTVTVTAATDGGTGTPQLETVANSPFVVDVKPAAPANLTVTPDPKQRISHISWTPNTEPDLVGYEIIRAGPSAGDHGSVVNGVSAPQASYTDDEVATEPPGTYRYQVVAVRPNGAGNGPDLSAPSVMVQDAFTTPPQAAPAPSAAPSGSSSGAAGPGAGGAAAPAGSSPTGGRAPAPASGPAIAPVEGSVQNYQGLLNQALATTVTTAPPDPGYATHLPYQATTTKPIALPVIGGGPQVLGAPDSTGSGLRNAEFVAAALLLFVLAMFGQVLKQAADRSVALEAVAPLGLLTLDGAGAAAADPAGPEPDPEAVDDPDRELVAEPESDPEPVRAIPVADELWPATRRRSKWAERASRVAMILASDDDSPTLGNERGAPARFAPMVPAAMAPPTVAPPALPHPSTTPPPSIPATPATSTATAAPVAIPTATTESDLSPLILTMTPNAASERAPVS